MSKQRINKDKVIDDLLLLIAKKNKQIIELEGQIQAHSIDYNGLKR